MVANQAHFSEECWKEFFRQNRKRLKKLGIRKEWRKVFYFLINKIDKWCDKVISKSRKKENEKERNKK